MLKVETAGQSTHTMSGNQLKLIGMVDAHVFRSRVLEQREVVKMNLTSSGDRQIELLEKIAASLEKLEQQLTNRK